MLTLDTETSSMPADINRVEAVRPKAINKLSAMFCNHSCMAICFYLRILAVAHTLCSAWALGACGNPFLYITHIYITSIVSIIHEIRSRYLGRQKIRQYLKTENSNSHVSLTHRCCKLTFWISARSPLY